MPITIKCGQRMTVYTNSSTKPLIATVEIEDTCSGPSQSEIMVLKIVKGEPVADPHAMMKFDKPGTIVSYTVPPKSFIRVDCNGEKGAGCRVSVSVIAA